jgi:hypothetical protein
MKEDKYFIEYQCEKCGYKGEQAGLLVWKDEDGEVIDSTECCTRCGEYEKFYKWSGVHIGNPCQVLSDIRGKGMKSRITLKDKEGNVEYKTYKISLIGCDDSTEFNMELTKKQAALLGIVASKSKETSEYRCMPVMEIKLLGDEELPF